MRELMNKMEAYFMKEMREKGGVMIAFLIPILIIPSIWVRFLFLLFVASSLLPRDVHHGRLHLLTSLPFSRSDVFWLSYMLFLIVGIFSSFINSVWWGTEAGMDILRIVTFSNAYFGICMLSVTFGLDHFAIPLAVFFMDTILGSIGNTGTNPYIFISPVYQENLISALAFSFIILITSWVLFERKGASK